MAKRVTSGGTTNTFWLHKDRLGSVQAITDSAGAEVFRKKYRPYGETLAQSGSNTESLGWIGERNDSETGFTYLHARYYSSGLGVFLSPDPLHPETQGVGLHRYGYGLGNPIGAIDRDGLASCAVADLVQEAPNCSDSCSPAKDQLLDVVQPVAPWLAQECAGGSCLKTAISELTLQPALSVVELAPQKQMAITLLGCVDGSCSLANVWSSALTLRSSPRRNGINAASHGDDCDPAFDPFCNPLEDDGGTPRNGRGDGYCDMNRSRCIERIETNYVIDEVACGFLPWERLLELFGSHAGCMAAAAAKRTDGLRQCQRDYDICVRTRY